MSKSDTARYGDILEAVRQDGEIVERRGGLEIGSVPGRPGAMLHVVFPPADDDLIRGAEEDLGRKMPDAYRTFLKVMNGLYLYDGALQLMGVVPDDRESERPPDLLTPNLRERPQGATDDLFFFGFYNWDGTLLFADGDGRVFRTDGDELDQRNEWESIADAIFSEWTRLRELFADGFDLDLKTVPD